MEFHPIKNYRERKIEERATLAAHVATLQIANRLFDGDIDDEIRVPLGKSPRGIEPGDFLIKVAGKTLYGIEALGAEKIIDYDPMKSRNLSPELRNWGGSDLYDQDGLTAVFVPSGSIEAKLVRVISSIPE